MSITHYNHHKFFLGNIPKDLIAVQGCIPKLEVYFQEEVSLAESILPKLTPGVRKRRVWREGHICIHYITDLPKLGQGLSAPVNCQHYYSDKGYFTVEDIIQNVSDFFDKRQDKDIVNFIRCLHRLSGVKPGEIDERTRRQKLAGKCFWGFDIDWCDSPEREYRRSRCKEFQCIKVVIDKDDPEPVIDMSWIGGLTDSDRFESTEELYPYCDKSTPTYADIVRRGLN